VDGWVGGWMDGWIGGWMDKDIRCYCQCDIIEWVVHTEATCSNALFKRRYLDVNSTAVYCTGNFIPGRSIFTSLKKSNKTCCI
jgi:hypothetical protein